MILRRIVVRHFKGIREAKFENLSHQLNLFYGANESGKSTLVEAIHFGLFERSVGEARAKRDIRTWNGTEAPEVEVDFEDDAGELWRVHKRFLLQPFTSLEGRNVHLKGDDAEKRLREMLGTERGKNTGVVDADLGIWPLLWVRQGRSGIAVKEDTHDGARATLSTTLASQTGEIVAGEQGERIRAAARAGFEEHFTATGRFNAAYEKVQAAAREAAELAAELRARWEAARSRVEDLQQAEGRLQGLEPRLAELRREAVKAKELAEAARQVHQEVERARSRHQLADARAQQAEDALRERTDVEAAHQAAVVALAASRHTHAAAQQAHSELEAKRAVASDAVQAAKSNVLLARAAFEAQGREAERAGLVQRIAALEATKGQVEDLMERLRALQASIDASPLGPSELSRIEEAERERVRLLDRLEAAAVRVSVTALQAGTLDGVARAAGHHEVRAITEPGVLRLDDRWTVQVDPGRARFERSELEAAEAKVRSLLAAVELGSVPEARDAVETRRGQEAEKRALVGQLALVGSEGVSPLIRELASLRQKLAAMPAAAGTGSVEQLEAARALAEKRLTEAEVDLGEIDLEAKKLAERLGEAKASLRAAEEQHEHTRLRQAKAAPLPEVAATAEAARAERSAAKEALAEVEQRWALAGGAGVEEGARVAAEALAGLERRAAALREEVVGLRAAVRAHAQEGLYDQLGAAEAVAVRAQDEADALARRAAARRALHEALESAWRRMRDRFVEPVRKAVEAEVPLLFPGSRLWVDEAGDVVGLITRGQQEQFELLSGGAREQLGVLVRLGIARVLAGERRLPVLLDDALVNSDAERRGRMLEVLRRMSEHLQVLLFTCHDEDFDRLAAPWQQEVRGRPRRSA